MEILIYYSAFLIVLTIGGILVGKLLSVAYDVRGQTKDQHSLIHRIHGAHAWKEMSSRIYCLAVLAFNLLGGLVLFFMLYFQDFLPGGMKGLSADLAFNVAISFISNTNWQSYGGETTLSNITQMLGLGVQNFLSASTGICVLFALTRAFSRTEKETVGNFWKDMYRVVFIVLLPISIVYSIVLMNEGVVQTFTNSVVSSSFENPSTEMKIPLGPVASQVAIKQLGTNGGGFYNVNSAHPFENPTPFSNFLETLAILLIPAACCFFFGREVGNMKEGYVLYSVMLLVFALALAFAIHFEMLGNQNLNKSISQTAGNMEGKEVRFGTPASVLFAVSTTSASNGSVNSMHDSFTPITGLVCMAMMQLGEVIFGGVGSGLYGMIAFALTAVFIAGLMVGRTPEYLGKKINAFEIKMVCLVILIPCILTLVGTAWGMLIPDALSSVSNPGPHGFSQILYAYSSMGNNNGSAFGGFGANNPYHNYMGGIVMAISRYLLIIPILSLAGSLVRKKIVPRSVGTLPTDTVSFLLLLTFIVILVGALSFFPALALGPIAEFLI